MDVVVAWMNLRLLSLADGRKRDGLNCAQLCVGLSVGLLLGIFLEKQSQLRWDFFLRYIVHAR